MKGNPIAVDWAEPEEDVDDDIMKEVKVLYVRNLLIETSEESLRAHFSQFGAVERVKKIRDYAFVHFVERESADAAVKSGCSQRLDGELLENLKLIYEIHFNEQNLLIHRFIKSKFF